MIRTRRQGQDRGIAGLLATVWSSVSRHEQMADVLARLIIDLDEALPIASLAFLRLDRRRLTLETLSTVVGSADGEIAARRETLPIDVAEEIHRWCAADSIAVVAANERESVPRELLTGDERSSAIIASIANDHGQCGVVRLEAQPESAFTEAHLALIATLREPLRVAADNDHRYHELVALREAAEADNRSLRSRLGRSEHEELIGSGGGLKDVSERIELVASSDVPVLIMGETGSGKEMVARAIHTRSSRLKGPFLRVNCGAIPPELIDSELFGHERGSFTGAVAERKGWFERANNGTLFLDECGELPSAAQVRLLRILQDGIFERVGGEKPVSVDVRVVAATNRDLHAMVASGEFRHDLWYRLAVFPIHLPPLRERLGDIAELASHLTRRAAERFGFPLRLPTPEDISLLMAYPWPGNVRELRTVIERAVLLGEGRRLEIAKALGISDGFIRSTPEVKDFAPSSPAPNGFPTLNAIVTAHIEKALTATRGCIEGRQGAARLLGVNPHTLRARMRKLGIDWRRFRPNLA